MCSPDPIRRRFFAYLETGGKRVEMKYEILENCQDNDGLARREPRMWCERANSPRVCSPGLIRRRFCAYLEKSNKVELKCGVRENRRNSDALARGAPNICKGGVHSPNEHVVQTFCFPDLLHSLEKEKGVEMKCGIWGNHQNNAGLAGTPRMRWEAVNSPRMCSPGLIRRRFCAYLEKRRTKSGK